MAQDDLNVYAAERAGEKSDWFTVLPQVLQGDVTRTSQLFLCTKALGLMLQFVTANEAGAATFTPKILVPNGTAGGADLVIVTFTGITANGTVTLVVYPGGGAADMGTEDKVATLPREWKLELTYAGTPGTDKMDTLVYGRYI